MPLQKKSNALIAFCLTASAFAADAHAQENTTDPLLAYRDIPLTIPVTGGDEMYEALKNAHKAHEPAASEDGADIQIFADLKFGANIFSGGTITQDTADMFPVTLRPVIEKAIKRGILPEETQINDINTSHYSYVGYTGLLDRTDRDFQIKAALGLGIAADIAFKGAYREINGQIPVPRRDAQIFGTRIQPLASVMFGVTQNKEINNYLERTTSFEASCTAPVGKGVTVGLLPDQRRNLDCDLGFNIALKF